MIGEFEYLGVRFAITHEERVDLYLAVADQQDLPVALTISASTLLGLLQGIKSSMDAYRNAGHKGVLQGVWQEHGKGAAGGGTGSATAFNPLYSMWSDLVETGDGSEGTLPRTSEGGQG